MIIVQVKNKNERRQQTNSFFFLIKKPVFAYKRYVIVFNIYPSFGNFLMSHNVFTTVIICYREFGRFQNINASRRETTKFRKPFFGRPCLLGSLVSLSRKCDRRTSESCPKVGPGRTACFTNRFSFNVQYPTKFVIRRTRLKYPAGWFSQWHIYGRGEGPQPPPPK